MNGVTVYEEGCVMWESPLERFVNDWIVPLLPIGIIIIMVIVMCLALYALLIEMRRK